MLFRLDQYLIINLILKSKHINIFETSATNTTNKIFKKTNATNKILKETTSPTKILKD